MAQIIGYYMGNRPLCLPCGEKKFSKHFLDRILEGDIRAEVYCSSCYNPLVPSKYSPKLDSVRAEVRKLSLNVLHESANECEEIKKRHVRDGNPIAAEYWSMKCKIYDLEYIERISHG